MDNHSEGLSKYSNWECFRHSDYCANSIPVHLPMSGHHLFNDYISFGFNLSFLWAPWSGLLFLLLFSHSVVSDSLWPPQTVAPQSPLSMGFFKQEYWIGLPLSSPEVLPDPGIKLASPGSPALARGFFTIEEILISFLLSTSLKFLHPLSIITSTLTTCSSIDWSPMIGMCVSVSPPVSEMLLPKASSLQIISDPS